MAQRIVRNDFVAGEISPELWGRHDVEMFFHGAAVCQNFVPRKTGGVRKRAGTELLWHIDGAESRDYRIVPYRFDKDAYGLLALYRKGTGTQVYFRFWSSRSGYTSEFSIPFLSISTDVSLRDIRYTQIGDTIFFTLHGRRAWIAKIVFSTKEVSWWQLNTASYVASPPEMTTTASGFGSGEGYVAASRTYALWGVRNGVRSSIRTKEQAMTLEWKAGAYIDVTFTPNWAAHDYYILGKLQGGQFGEVARFYRDGDGASRADTESLFGGSRSTTGSIDNVTYTAATDNVSTLWKTTDPNTITDNVHDCGTWNASVGIQHSTHNAVALAIKAWFGARMSYTSSGSTAYANVGITTTVHAVLRKTDSSGEIVAEWDITPGYQETESVLSIDNPTAAPDGKFFLQFFTDARRTTPVYVPMRGMFIVSDTGQKKYHDDNIQPGTLVGEQDLLQVGFSGMDVDLITTWQQRLVAASSDQMPFTLWFSALGDLYNFYVDRPQNADNAFEATIASTDANKILHIVAQKWLLVFTESGEHVVDASGGALAYNTVSVKRTSSVGAHPDIVPTTTESDVLFVAADARSVYKMDYSLERDAVVPSSVSTRASHLTELHRIKAIAYQRYPDSVLWCLLDDGTLASMTFVPEENVCGWARHTLAGGEGLVVEDVIETGAIRADAQTDTTSEVVLVLRHPDAPGDVWIERLRPCVVADRPTEAAASCRDHIGYTTGHFPPSGKDPVADVAAKLVTMRMEPQQADMIGKRDNAFGAVFRLRRSGVVQTRQEGSTKLASSAPVRDASPVVDNGRVALVQKDVRVQLHPFQNDDARIEVRSADKWPCEILSMLAMMEFGTQKWGG